MFGIQHKIITIAITAVIGLEEHAHAHTHTLAHSHTDTLTLGSATQISVWNAQLRHSLIPSLPETWVGSSSLGSGILLLGAGEDAHVLLSVSRRRRRRRRRRYATPPKASADR